MPSTEIKSPPLALEEFDEESGALLGLFFSIFWRIEEENIEVRDLITDS
jgi:hypothetical protein